MDFNKGFLEGWDLVPYGGDANSDITTSRVFVGHSKKVCVLVTKGAGTAGDDPKLTFSQATAASGGSTKVLTCSRWWYKKATTATFSPSTLWTAVDATASPFSTLDLGTPTDYAFDSSAVRMIFELDNLDVGNGYGWAYAFSDGGEIGNATQMAIDFLLSDVYAGAIPISKA